MVKKVDLSTRLGAVQYVQIDINDYFRYNAFNICEHRNTNFSFKCNKWRFSKPFYKRWNLYSFCEKEKEGKKNNPDNQDEDALWERSDKCLRHFMNV